MTSRKFILRIQTSQGMHRLNFDSPNSTYSDLQNAIEKKYGVKPKEQIISLDRPSVNPKFLQGQDNDTLQKLSLKHGQILWLVMGQNHLSSYREIEKKLNPTKKSPHKQPRSVTLSTSKWVNDPKHKIQDTGPKHTPFHEFIEERQKKYSKQPWNIDPPKYDYSSKPYSNNIKFSELPKNAIVKRQEYRHIDVVSFLDTGAYNRFIKDWYKDQQVQRMAYLIGRYSLEANRIDKKKEKEGKKLMYGHVYTLYIPPQKGTEKGVKLLKDPNEKLVDRILEAMELQRIGWTITTLPRGDKKHKGDIFMTGDEIMTAARLQNKYKNENTGYSKFMTLITHIGTKEPQGFQISDQGVAMLKHGLIGPDEDWGFMKVKPHPPRVYVPGVINENKLIKPNENFLPDALLVNVIATKSKTPQHIFTYVNFPADGGVTQLKKHLSQLKTVPYHQSLSDFNLLVYLPQILGIDFVCNIAKHVINKQRLSSETTKLLDAKFNHICGGL